MLPYRLKVVSSFRGALIVLVESCYKEKGFYRKSGQFRRNGQTSRCLPSNAAWLALALRQEEREGLSKVLPVGRSAAQT
jgi:hypothetical protein